MSTKAEIIERLNLPVLIAELIPSVKPTGAELSGLCPFHDDQAPSMPPPVMCSPVSWS